MKNYQLVSISIVEKLKLQTNMKMLYCDPELYTSIIRKLIQLQHTRPNISYAIRICITFIARPQLL